MRQIALYREISGPAARQPKTDRLILAKLLDRASKDFRIEEEQIAAAHRVLLRWAEMETSGQLGTFNETQLQGMLLAQVFGEALGYAQPTDSPELWHQEQHRSTGPGQTPDAALGRFTPHEASVLAVVELKGPSIHLDRDRSAGRTAVDQCWDYLVNTPPTCRWGIVSNMVSFRLYERDSTKRAYEHFTLQGLRDLAEFRRFYVLLRRQGLIEGVGKELPRALQLLRETNDRQREVSDELYKNYSHHRFTLIEYLLAQGHSPDDAVEMAQRLFDRVIFIAFCEDRHLLPEKTLQKASAVAGFHDVTNPRWRQFKNLFKFVDVGNEAYGIPRYNGGLFQPHPVDDLDLPDEPWTKFFESLSTYDFRDEVNLDVLGHLFERSITELEKIKQGGLLEAAPARRQEYAAMPQSAKRKQLGIYYTPPELTSRIVQYTVEELIRERFAAAAVEFGVSEEAAKRGFAPDDERFWRRCLAILTELKIVDPACGSGAFLFQAYNVLEQRYNEVIGHLEALETKTSGSQGEGEAPAEPGRAPASRLGGSLALPGDAARVPGSHWQDASGTQATPMSAAELYARVPHWILSGNLYGVDLSPEAVEITQLALWIRSATAGQTLAVLSRNIVHGNSLVHDRSVDPQGFDWRERFPEVFERGTSHQPSGSLPLEGRAGEGVEAGLPDQSEKDKATRVPRSHWQDASGTPRSHWQDASGTRGHRVPASSPLPGASHGLPHLRSVTTGDHARLVPPPQGEGTGGSAARAGFDCVIGNPPWERIKLQEREFFSLPAPEIATATNAAKRRQLVAKLEAADPALYERYQEAQASAEMLLTYCRKSGAYPLTGRGDINLYAAFAELAYQIVAPEGRVGLLTPSGIASDKTTMDFFAAIAESNRLIRLYDFENRTKRMFPEVDGRFKFCILNFGGGAKPQAAADFVFFAHHVDELEDKKRHVALSGTDIRLLNPNTRTCPIFRTKRDAEITKAIYRRVPVLVDANRKGPTGNAWGIKFKTMFHQTNDAELFREGETLKGEGFKLTGNRWVKGKDVFLPVYEAKMVQAYDHRAADVVTDEANWVRQGQTARTTLVSWQNPEHLATPRFWVSAAEVQKQLDQERTHFLAFKDVTSPTNQRTMIAAMLPIVGVVNSAPLVFTETEPCRECCLLANFNSFAFDYVMRQKISNVHLNFFLVEQIPTLPPEVYAKPCPWERGTTLEAWISERVLKLTCTAEDMLPLAEACGFTGGSFQREYGGRLNRWDEAERAVLMAELDAAYFHLYGVAREDAEYILSTFKGIHARSPLFAEQRTVAQQVLWGLEELG